jgi:exopolysaccharide biosynthesis polyprenyl glycosylphosphotransferase
MYSGDLTVVDGGASATPGLTPNNGAATGSAGEASSASAMQHTLALPADQSAAGSAVTADSVTEYQFTSTSGDDVARWSAALDRSSTPVTHRDSWHRGYAMTLVAIDLAAAFVAVVLATLIPALLPGAPFAFGARSTFCVCFAVLLPLAWVGVIALNRGYQNRIVGVGAAEFQRVFRAFCHLTAVVVFVAYALRVESARGVILTSLPLALTLDLIGRYAARKRLHRQRSRGRSLTSVVAVGGAASVADFSVLLQRDRYAGMHVIGACLPSDQLADVDAAVRLGEQGVRILGDVDSVLDAVRDCGAHTVAVLAGDISADKLRWISWQLEGTDTDLVVSLGLTEVAGTRLHIQPVAGLPMLHVEEPEFTGFRRILKGAFDRAMAAIIILFSAPLLIGLAIAVRVGSRGPAFFRQVRVGLDGRVFTMIKYRSMHIDAEHRLAELVEHNVNADGLLFKVKDDPRITRVGRFIRKYSLDELPQLINVLKGEMSLVGPRPPLPAEVACYGADVRRRLLVKPGMTGMWQISGRNDLAWDESVRLDLRYVENWSFALDLMILWKTIFAVARGAGAY